MKQELTEQDYKDMLELNRLDLETAQERQATLFNRVGDHAIDAYARLSLAKLECKALEANLSLQIREKFAASGEKATEGKIKETLENNPELQSAQSQVILADIEFQKWDHLKWSYRQRADMIVEMSRTQNQQLNAYGRG